MKNILFTICARGGSKSVVDKNIRLMNGKSLIGYSIEQAFRFRGLISDDFNSDISLSTDSDKIRSAAIKFGLSTDYRRPEQFATDKAGKVAAIKDVLLYNESLSDMKYDYVIDLDVTAPLRTMEDLTASLALMEGDAKALTLFSVSKPHRNPYFNMVEEKSDGYVELVKPLSGAVLSRQEAPLVYDMNASFYIYRRSFFDASVKSVITERSLAYVMPHVCFDIDYEIDFDIMEYLVQNKKLDFTF